VPNFLESERTATLVPAADIPNFLPPRSAAMALSGNAAVRLLEWRPTRAQAVGGDFMEDVVHKLCREHGATDEARVVYWLAL
jgi:hypothetical protein